MQLMRRAALPMLPSKPACPAAMVIHGACASNSGVICRSMERDRQAIDGTDMDPRQFEIAKAGGVGDVFLTLKSDPSTIERFCCGDGVPVVHDGEHHGGRDTYTYCPVRQAEIWAKEHDQEGLGSRPVDEPESVESYDDSMGSSSADAADPWAQATADLELLG